MKYLDEDTKLMVKASRGDKKAFAEIYVKYFSIVVSFILSLGNQFQTTEDITQDVFMRIWVDHKKYRPTSSLKTFLFAYAKNVFYEYKSKKGKEKALFANDFDVAIAVLKAKGNGKDEIKDSAAFFIKLIYKLPDKQKRITELVYLFGKSPKESAKQLKCSLHSVHQSLYLARKNLHKFYLLSLSTSLKVRL